MATHSSPGLLHGNTEERTSYIEWLECYFTANDITSPNKKLTTVLALCGTSAYSQSNPQFVGTEQANGCLYTHIID